MAGTAWLCVRIAVGVSVVVVPFGYAITGVHKDVLMGVGSGLAFGVGLGLRMAKRAGLSTGILIGSVAGLITALLAGIIPQDGTLFIVPPVVALAVGLVDGNASGIVDWMSFSFFTALARDYMDIIPVSVAARALVGGHLILSIGWGLVVFAAVMSYIQPQIERISLREKTASDDQGSP